MRIFYRISDHSYDFCVWDHHARGFHPNDFMAFLDLPSANAC